MLLTANALSAFPLARQPKLETAVEKLLTLQAKLADLDGKMSALLENDDLTEEQRADYKALEADYKKTADAIAREEQRLARADQQKNLADRIAAQKAEKAEKELAEKEKQEAERVDELDRTKRELAIEKRKDRAVTSGRLTDTDLPEQARARSIIPATVKVYGALKNFKGEKRGLHAEERSYRFGMWVLAKVSSDMPNRYRFQSAQEWISKNLASSKSNDSTGNFNLIPEEFGTDLIDLRETYGVVRRLFKMIPMTSDTRTDPRRVGGLTAVFVAEGAPGTESNKTWNNVRLTAKDLMVLSRYTNQLNMDAVINIGDDLAGEIAYAFTNKEDECGFNGDGTSTYGHIVGLRNKLQDCAVPGAGTDSIGLIVGSAGSGAAYTSFVLSDFNKVVGMLPQYADTKNAAWITHRSFYYGTMQRLEMAAGGTTMMEIAGGDRRPRPMFMGYPVEFSQVFPTTPALAQVVATLGDYSLGARFGDRQMDEIAFSEHATIGGENVFERNEIAIRGTERFDINVHDVGSATVAGPIVGLQTAAS